MLGIFFDYPTYQVLLAIAIAAVVTIGILPFWIRLLKVRQIGQQIRADGPQRHLVKQGTPTMGGVIMLLAVTVTVLLLGHPNTSTDMVSLWLVMGATLLTGALGLIDDVLKVVKRRSLGLTPKAKLAIQGLICLAFTLGVVNLADVSPEVALPPFGTIDLGVLSIFIGDFQIPWIYVIFVFFLMGGLSNAVNLTDGLDGLAGGTVMIAMVVMAAIAFRVDMIDIAVFAAAIAGACIGFLWFNSYPADIFMGDTGSLAFGTALAAVGIVTKTEVASLIVGGLFVIEACSVIIQVGHYKRTHKRVFLMAPIHHHFEKKGWSETKVVFRFYIVAGLFACVGFVIFFLQTLM